MRGVSVSIAMATYNGAAFLEPQLASIASQTRLPTELVVCDDGSTDHSLEIVEQFAARAPFEVRLVRNPARLGHAENFLQAARLCRGDVVAWSDQDDVWMPEKLARCAQEFELDPQVVLVVHSRQIGERVRAAGGEWISRGNRRRVLRRSVHTATSLPLDTSYPGYATVISRRVLQLADALAATLPGIVEQFFGHDTWTSFLATAVGKVALLPDVLVDYRQHPEQTSGGALPPQTMADRAKASAGLSQRSVDDDLRERASRAFFRASILTQLAAHLDAEAGFGLSAADFRDSLREQLRAAPEHDEGLLLSALARAGMWHSHGQVLRRRLELWRQRPATGPALSRLVRATTSGDYRSRDRGGLGPSSFARDLWRVADLRSAVGRHPA